VSFRWVWDGGSSPDFDAQQGAEDWMGTEWGRLLDGGVLVASLMDGERRLYEMKLTQD
jgi:hypothetical protein